jgi:uncharacterized integral membrane protein
VCINGHVDGYITVVNPHEDDATGSVHEPQSAEPYIPSAESFENVETLSAEPRHSRTGGVLVGMIVAAIVFVLLLIFILQNTANVTIHFFGITGRLPIAVALLLAAICGLLLVAIPGAVRIAQLRKSVKRSGQAPYVRH